MPAIPLYLVLIAGVLAQPARADSTPYYVADSVADFPKTPFITLGPNPVRKPNWAESPEALVLQDPQLERTLGGGPGGTSLALSALASIGLWRLGRIVRSIGSVPEWCHDSAPQVGYTLPITFDQSGQIRAGDAPLFVGTVEPQRFLALETAQFAWCLEFGTIQTSPRSPPR